jgi:hypothetical protein
VNKGGGGKMNPRKSIDLEFDHINVYPGETLTVWLNRTGRNDDIRDACQIEVRVDSLGRAELFISDKTHTPKIHQDFSEWEPLS